MMQITYPQAWLHDRLHFGIFKNGKMVGGFGSKISPPFEKLDALDEQTRLVFLSKFPLEDLIQHNGMWLDSEDKSNLLSAALYYFMARRTGSALIFGKRAVIFNYNRLSLGLENIHRHYRQGTLYTGVVQIGDKKYEVAVAYNSLWKGFGGLLILSCSRLMRFRRKRRYSLETAVEEAKKIDAG